MANYGPDDVAFVLLGGYNLRDNLTEFSDDTEAILEETTVLGSSWKSQAYVGLRQAKLDLSGFYDDAALADVEALSTRYGTSRVLCYGLEGNTAGKKFVGYQGAMQVNVERVAKRGELHKLNTKLEGNGAVEEGVIVRALSTASAGTGQTASIDQGASSTRGGVGYFQLRSLVLDTATGLITWIRHSEDDAVFANLITFTRATSTAVVPGAERVDFGATGLVERYIAGAWEFGTTAAPGGATRNAEFMLGFVRGTP